MKYETYNSTKHTLEVGTKIRLGGREGEILSSSVNMAANNVWYKISWNDDIDATQLFLLNYPLLEIADKPTKPLTIDKRVKEKLMEFKRSHITEAADVSFESYLDSLEET